MQNILIIEEKGGSGKTTICSELVGSFKRTGTPSAFYDLDGQGGTLFEPYADDDAVVSVIDTPGSIQDRMGVWVSSANVVIIPTRCSQYDIPSFMRTLEIYKANRKKKCKLFIVLNQFTRWRSSTEFMEGIRKQNTGAEILTLPQSEIFLQAGMEQMTVIDYRPRSDAAKSCLALINTVRKAVKLPEEII